MISTINRKMGYSKQRQPALNAGLLLPNTPLPEIAVRYFDLKQIPGCYYPGKQEGTVVMTDYDDIERDENRLWRIEELQREIKELRAKHDQRRWEHEQRRWERHVALPSGVTVSPEAHDPENTRLQMVDVVGQLADIGDLRQELADKAKELGGDVVCEMTVTPVGDDQVLVSGLAAKSAARVKSERQEAKDAVWYKEEIAAIREEIEELEDLLGASVARR